MPRCARPASFRRVLAIVAVLLLVGGIGLRALVPSGYVSNSCHLEGRHLVDMYDLLERFTLLMAQENVTWWADYGLLLGAVRQRSILPWDKDLDVGMLQRDGWRYAQLRDSGAFQRHGMAAHAGTVVLAKDAGIVTDGVALEDLPQRIEIFQYAVKPNGEFLRDDIFDAEVHRKAGTFSKQNPGLVAEVVYRIQKWWSDVNTHTAEVFPLRTVTLVLPELVRQGLPRLPAQMVLPAPALPERILFRLYGRTWRVNIKWKFNCYLPSG